MHRLRNDSNVLTQTGGWQVKSCDRRCAA